MPLLCTAETISLHEDKKRCSMPTDQAKLGYDDAPLPRFPVVIVIKMRYRSLRPVRPENRPNPHFPTAHLWRLLHERGNTPSHGLQ